MRFTRSSVGGTTGRPSVTPREKKNSTGSSSCACIRDECSGIASAIGLSLFPRFSVAFLPYSCQMQKLSAFSYQLSAEIQNEKLPALVSVFLRFSPPQHRVPGGMGFVQAAHRRDQRHVFERRRGVLDLLGDRE